jgi:hypothetical protein
VIAFAIANFCNCIRSGKWPIRILSRTSSRAWLKFTIQPSPNVWLLWVHLIDDSHDSSQNFDSRDFAFWNTNPTDTTITLNRRRCLQVRGYTLPLYSRLQIQWYECNGKSRARGGRKGLNQVQFKGSKFWFRQTPIPWPVSSFSAVMRSRPVSVTGSICGLLSSRKRGMMTKDVLNVVFRAHPILKITLVQLKLPIKHARVHGWMV